MTKKYEDLTLEEKEALSSTEKGTAWRYNQGKIPLHLVSPIFIYEVGKVLAHGARKYSERNWEKGGNWSIPIASADRHWKAFLCGEDRDMDTGLLHLSHLACNIMFLICYYFLCPDKDDRSAMNKAIHDKWLAATAAEDRSNNTNKVSQVIPIDLPYKDNKVSIRKLIEKKALEYGIADIDAEIEAMAEDIKKHREQQEFNKFVDEVSSAPRDKKD